MLSKCFVFAGISANSPVDALRTACVSGLCERRPGTFLLLVPPSPTEHHLHSVWQGGVQTPVHINIICTRYDKAGCKLLSTSYAIVSQSLTAFEWSHSKCCMWSIPMSLWVNNVWSNIILSLTVTNAESSATFLTSDWAHILTQKSVLNRCWR